MPQILSKCGSADDGAIIELYPIGLARRAKLPQALQISDRIKERRMRPWLRDALRLCESNGIGSRLFDDAETVKPQLADYRCFSGARCPGQYESFHSVSRSCDQLSHLPVLGWVDKRPDRNQTGSVPPGCATTQSPPD